MARAKLREIAQAAQTDPKQALIDSVGGRVNDINLHGPRVMVATYVRPEMTKGGIILADRSQQEDRYQGKVGLVLKTGPLAFVDDGIAKFGGAKAEVGDWVMYRASDGFEIFILDDNGRDGTPCRILEDQSIIAVVDDPSAVY